MLTELADPAREAGTPRGAKVTKLAMLPGMMNIAEAGMDRCTGVRTNIKPQLNTGAEGERDLLLCDSSHICIFKPKNDEDEADIMLFFSFFFFLFFCATVAFNF